MPRYLVLAHEAIGGYQTRQHIYVVRADTDKEARERVKSMLTWPFRDTNIRAYTIDEERPMTLVTTIEWD